MQLQVRQMLREDAKQLQSLFERFASEYVGPLARDIKFFRRAVRKKDELKWVALDQKEQIVGYVIASYDKRRRAGRINELVVDPKQDFSLAGKLLAEKAQSILIEKGAAVIRAYTMRNPGYLRVFPELGFLRIETSGLFMLAVNNVSRFLHEVEPIIVARLKRVQEWNGILELRCGESSVYFRKVGDDVQFIDWTNCDVDYKIAVGANTLGEILLGATQSEEALKDGRINVETSLSEEKAKELATLLFPKPQFLAVNFW
jgi:hypothetical protein